MIKISWTARAQVSDNGDLLITGAYYDMYIHSKWPASFRAEVLENHYGNTLYERKGMAATLDEVNNLISSWVEEADALLTREPVFQMS